MTGYWQEAILSTVRLKCGHHLLSRVHLKVDTTYRRRSA